MNGMYDDRDGLRAWAYTGDRTQWEVLLLKLPRSVSWKFWHSELRSS